MSTQRPYLICHMMTSLDGKITSGTSQDIFDDEYLPLYEQTDDQQETQGWMCGRVTMEMFAEDVNTQLPTANNIYEEDFKGTVETDQFSIAVDTKGQLRWKSNTISSSINLQRKYSLIVIVTKETPAEYLSYLTHKNISYITAGGSNLDWGVALSKLYSLFGIKKLSVQGGGKINGSLLKAGMINELSLLMIPFAVNNSKAPTIFEQTVTPETFKTYGFKLIEVKQLEKDVVWLRYTVS